MLKIFIIILISAAIIITPILAFNYYLNDYAFESIDMINLEDVPKKFLSGDTPEELKQNLMYFVSPEGKFEGVTATTSTKGQLLVINMKDNNPQDNTLGIIEHRFTAQKYTDGFYEVNGYSTRHTCKNYPTKVLQIFSQIINPLWTKQTCL
jgi:hypothetical protein